MNYKRIEISFKYKDFEPYIDEETMKTHYEKHHLGYETKLNEALKGTAVENKYSNIEELMKNYQNESRDLVVPIREFGGGLINHNFLFTNMKVGTKLNKDSELSKKIDEEFGSFEKFWKEFESVALKVFGSGWAWLVKREDGSLKVIKTFNQDNPWFLGLEPIFGIDVWEHAYYLKYKSARAEYIKNFYNVIDWDKAEKNYLK